MAPYTEHRDRHVLDGVPRLGFDRFTNPFCEALHA